MRFITVQNLVAVAGRPTAWVLNLLARSQVSRSVWLRGIGYVPFQVMDALLGLNALRLIINTALRKRERKSTVRIKNPRLRAILYLAVSMSGKDSAAQSQDAFRAMLRSEKLDPEGASFISHQLFQSGRLDFACVSFADLIESSTNSFTLERRLQLFRDCGTAFFMVGKIVEANRYYALAGALKRLILGAEKGPTYRILGSSWFAAIGHVAMIDFYLKYRSLYGERNSRVVVQLNNAPSIPGNHLFEKFAKKGLDFIEMGTLEADYNTWAKRHRKRRWNDLTPPERAAMIDDFWEFEFPDGEIWGYTHAANKIQKEWERRQLPPLLSLAEEERQFIARAVGRLGVPENAWYVCLHVREPGFHQQWNSIYPSMRDANIDDYLPAIDLIVRSGGWVIRMGDPTMKPLPAIPGVVDYAHSSLKTPKADILISLGCRFFLGTNSGIATIPAIYGVRCVFTNWLPIGLPLWPSQDLVVPKLFWDENRQRCLTLEETFRTGLAFIQNWSDLPPGVSPRGNTAEEICDVAREAMGIDQVAADVSGARASYRQIAEQHGSYVGSTLAASFVARHPDLFCEPVREN